MGLHECYDTTMSFNWKLGFSMGEKEVTVFRPNNLFFVDNFCKWQFTRVLMIFFIANYKRQDGVFMGLDECYDTTLSFNWKLGFNMGETKKTRLRKESERD